MKALLYCMNGNVEEIEYIVSLSFLKHVLNADHVDYVDCLFGYRMWYNDDYLCDNPEPRVNEVASNFVGQLRNCPWRVGPPLLYGPCMLSRVNIDFETIDHGLNPCLWNACLYDEDDYMSFIEANTNFN